MKTLFFVALLAVAGAVGCVGRGTSVAHDEVLMASIEPLKYLVDSIVGGDFEVTVLVPPGSSPETYEPAPAAVMAAESAKLLFFTGLIDFERALVGRLPEPERFVDLSAGIEVIAGTCAHGHAGRGHASHGDHSGNHVHGIDPHIWVSPKYLARMASTAYDRIHEAYPDSASYTVNYKRLADRLAVLDSTVDSKLSVSKTRAFLIFHPGLTYYARDYGLQQIALERDGKEPSAKQLQQTIAIARAENITKVLYQSEFPRVVVEVASKEIGATPVEIDILGYDIVGNILKITDLIAE